MGKVGGNGPIDASSPNFVVTGKAIKFESNVLKNRLREPAARLSWWETSQSCRLILPFFFCPHCCRSVPLGVVLGQPRVSVAGRACVMQGVNSLVVPDASRGFRGDGIKRVAKKIQSTSDGR